MKYKKNYVYKKNKVKFGRTREHALKKFKNRRLIGKEKLELEEKINSNKFRKNKSIFLKQETKKIEQEKRLAIAKNRIISRTRETQNHLKMKAEKKKRI